MLLQKFKVCAVINNVCVRCMKFTMNDLISEGIAVILPSDEKFKC